jgi:hypothetical protein
MRSGSRSHSSDSACRRVSAETGGPAPATRPPRLPTWIPQQRLVPSGQAASRGRGCEYLLPLDKAHDHGRSESISGCGPVPSGLRRRARSR